jgi:hypothetical protein
LEGETADCDEDGADSLGFTDVSAWLAAELCGSVASNSPAGEPFESPMAGRPDSEEAAKIDGGSFCCATAHGMNKISANQTGNRTKVLQNRVVGIGKTETCNI